MVMLLKIYIVLVGLTNLGKAPVCVNCTIASADADSSYCPPGDYDEQQRLAMGCGLAGPASVAGCSAIVC